MVRKAERFSEKKWGFATWEREGIWQLPPVFEELP